MGASMALNLQAGEHEVAVNDLRRDAAAPHLKAGATWADGPREIAAHSEVIFTSLPGPREVEAVADILIEHMKPGTAWFDLSTNSPTVIRKLHARFAAKNIALLDAPVSGGPSGAKTRKLALLVGGDKAVFDKFKPALDAIGDQVIYIGPIGAGSVAKLVHNMAGYSIQTALAEVFSMGVKAGVEPLALWAAVRQCSLGRQRSFDRLGKQFLRGEFDPPDFALGRVVVKRRLDEVLIDQHFLQQLADFLAAGRAGLRLQGGAEFICELGNGMGHGVPPTMI